MGCGRVEHVCSADPCVAVLVEREECPTCGAGESEGKECPNCEVARRLAVMVFPGLDGLHLVSQRADLGSDQRQRILDMWTACVNLMEDLDLLPVE